MPRRKPSTAPRPTRAPRRHARPGRDSKPRATRNRADSEALWLYGGHAVSEALANPRRKLRRLLSTAEAVETAETALARCRGQGAGPPRLERVERDALAALLPPGAVHQGLALAAAPLAQPGLPELLRDLAAAETGAQRLSLVLLDQVTDPQNVGAVLRSAAAFGAAAVITTWRHAPPESGALAKAASGAFEHVPYVQVTNLVRAMERLRAEGFWLVGLASEGEQNLAEASPGERLGLVLGAEGSGLRHLVRATCDQLVRLPTQGPIDQLNVSNAAAVALYEILGRAGR